MHRSLDMLALLERNCKNKMREKGKKSIEERELCGKKIFMSHRSHEIMIMLFVKKNNTRETA